jgi:hypothetical protein
MYRRYGLSETADDGLERMLGDAIGNDGNRSGCAAARRVSRAER